MALSSYTELKAHIAANLFGRTDQTANIIDFIRLAEVHMNSLLKCREMATLATLTITDGVATVPTDLQSVLSIRLLTTPFSGVDYEPIEVMEARRPDVSGSIQYYDMVGEQFIFWPPASDSARLRYRQDIPALSDSNADNWVLDEYPHLYVYGALFEAYLFLKDDARAAKYENLFGAAVMELNRRSITGTIATMQKSANGAVV